MLSVDPVQYIMRRVITLLGCLAAAVGIAAPAGPSLKIGDSAPKLDTGEWVQGEPVKEFQPGKVYLIEFWATWCGPCRVSIPHLNALHTKFKDKGLVVIGQNCWERDESKVKPFVESMGSKMTYRIALDRKTGATDRGRMAETWMAAAGRTGIPSAFLVDQQGRIAWIGHPMALTDAILQQVLAGKWDLKKAAADYEEQERQRQEARQKALQKTRANLPEQKPTK